MATPFLGQIEAFAFGYAPKNWVPCNGQLLAVNQYQALFALIGTTYGGNGTTNFQLPNLQSRVAVGQGNGAGLTPRVLGEIYGIENETLLVTQIPTHTHAMNGNTATTGETNTPSNTTTLANAQLSTQVTPGGTTVVAMNLYAAAPGNVTLATTALATAGTSQPHPNLMPYLAIQFCIATSGLFPSRN